MLTLEKLVFIFSMTTYLLTKTCTFSDKPQNTSLIRYYAVCGEMNLRFRQTRTFNIEMSTLNIGLLFFWYCKWLGLIMVNLPTFEKQPLEVLCKKRCSEKFRKNHRKTPVPESFFNNELQALGCNFNKKETLEQVFSCEYCEISKNTFFTKHLRATNSVLWKREKAVLSKLRGISYICSSILDWVI